MILDRPRNKADGPAPPRGGLGLLGWLAALLTRHSPLQGCSSLAPCQPAQLPPAKSEFIFAKTLKEKSLAAMRAGVAQVIIPKLNEKDLVELPQEAHKKLRFILVENVDEVLAAALEKTCTSRRRHSTVSRNVVT